MDSGIIKYFFGTPSAPLFSAKNRIFSINEDLVGVMVPPKHKNLEVTAKLHRNSHTYSIANFIEPPYNAL